MGERASGSNTSVLPCTNLPAHNGCMAASGRSNRKGVKQMTLRQFLHDNFGWDIYDWADDEIRF
jgi:hypothetical protein